MAANPKITCSAFGCTRWTRKFPDSSEMLCRDHWMMAPKRLRKLYKKNQKLLAAQYSHEAWNRQQRLWAKCVAAANRNVGISM